MRTSRSGSATGSGRKRVALTKLKMAVLAPIASASDSTTTKLNAGRLAIIRSAKRKSWPNLDIVPPDRLRHAHEDLALTRKRRPRMRDQHVVEHQQVALAPRELDSRPPVGVAQVVEDLRLDRRAVPIIGIGRQVPLGELLEQRLLDDRLQGGDVEEGGMVEPQRLASLRVPGDSRADGAGAQPVPRLPLHLDAALPAVLLDLRLVGGLEDGLPGQAEAVAEVAHVHPT